MHRVPSFCASAARQLASVWLGLVVAAPWFGAALPAQGPKVELTTIDARVASGFADVTRDLVTIKQDDDSLLEVALSDVLSVTYVCVLGVHLLGSKSETENALFRYVAFACAVDRGADAHSALGDGAAHADGDAV